MTELASGARITGQVRADLTNVVAQRYRSGDSIRAIAADLGRSYGFIQRLLSEAKVEIRARGGDTRSVAARTRQAKVGAALAQARVVSQEGKERKDKKAKQKSKNKAAKAKKKAKPDESAPAKQTVQLLESSAEAELIHGKAEDDAGKDKAVKDKAAKGKDDKTKAGKKSKK